jgi:hypothetical protein
VAFAEDKPVSVCPVRVGRIMPEDPEVQGVRISTAESDPPGWPLPAVPIMVMISRRSFLARAFISSIESVLT